MDKSAIRNTALPNCSVAALPMRSYADLPSMSEARNNSIAIDMGQLKQMPPRCVLLEKGMAVGAIALSVGRTFCCQQPSLAPGLGWVSLAARARNFRRRAANDRPTHPNFINCEAGSAWSVGWFSVEPSHVCRHGLGDPMPRMRAAARRRRRAAWRWRWCWASR